MILIQQEIHVCSAHLAPDAEPTPREDGSVASDRMYIQQATHKCSFKVIVKST